MPLIRHPLSALALAVTLLLPGLTSAQNLQDLYEAARAYDAIFLSARALADSAEARVAQSEALLRPSASATASIAATQSNLPVLDNRGSTTVGGVNGRYPLFNRANSVSILQARKTLETAQADLGSADQDLVVRVGQAYFRRPPRSRSTTFAPAIGAASRWRRRSSSRSGGPEGRRSMPSGMPSARSGTRRSCRSATKPIRPMHLRVQ